MCIQDTAFLSVLLTQPCSARAVWDLLAGGARLGKRPRATPHSYLLWWTLCILLHCPHINDSMVKEQVDVWNKLLLLVLLSCQKSQLFSASLLPAVQKQWGAVSQADTRHSMGSEHSGAEPLEQGLCTPRLAWHIFPMKARACNLLHVVVFQRRRDPLALLVQTRFIDNTS